jgi:hypothetical protein
MNTSTESYLRERVKELENQLAKERAENLVILENVRFSTRSVRDQTVFMMIMLCLQTHRISMLEKLTLDMRSHPIMLFYLFKERTALTC